MLSEPSATKNPVPRVGHAQRAEMETLFLYILFKTLIKRIILSMPIGRVDFHNRQALSAF